MVVELQVSSSHIMKRNAAKEIRKDGKLEPGSLLISLPQRGAVIAPGEYFSNCVKKKIKRTQFD